MAIELPTGVASAPWVISTTQSEASSFDERWAAWRAKGAAHDRAVRRKMAIAAPILIVVAVVLYALLGR
jgi:ferric-dicitrate binding protein FerR (iron transport regulator)